MIRRPPGSTRTDTIFPLHDALPISPLKDAARRRWQRRARAAPQPAFPGRPRGPGRPLPPPCVGAAARRPFHEDTHGPHQESRSEEHTSELQSLMRISYAVFCLKKTKKIMTTNTTHSMKHNNT